MSAVPLYRLNLRGSKTLAVKLWSEDRGSRVNARGAPTLPSPHRDPCRTCIEGSGTCVESNNEIKK